MNDKDERTPPKESTDAQKFAQMFPGLPPEDELREKMSRIKEDVKETFGRMKRERKSD